MVSHITRPKVVEFDVSDAWRSLESTLMMNSSSDTAASTDTLMLSERVYRAILELVMRGQLRRGAPLRIEELSRLLQVSPTPVREGLARLEATGLVVHERRKGFRIAPPLTLDQLEHLMDARELLEVGAAGFASAAGGPKFVEALDAALARQRTAVMRFHASQDGLDLGRDAAWAVIESDLEFHRVILEHTDNPYVGLMAAAILGQFHRVRQNAEKGVSDDFEALNEHDTIVSAAHTGDVSLVQNAMRFHIGRVRARADLDPT
jgi:DNA-binding GntR family transcriptional regulator